MSKEQISIIIDNEDDIDDIINIIGDEELPRPNIDKGALIFDIRMKSMSIEIRSIPYDMHKVNTFCLNDVKYLYSEYGVDEVIVRFDPLINKILKILIPDNNDKVHGT